MFWRSYGRVILWLLAAGAIVGAAFLLVFGLLVPPDRGEESALLVVPFIGAFFGVLTAAAASALYGFALWLWTRPARRSVASRSWLGAAAAGIGVLGFWLVFGFMLSGTYGLPVWGKLGAVGAGLAMVLAGPLTARASRRADRLDPAPSEP